MDMYIIINKNITYNSCAHNNSTIVVRITTARSLHSLWFVTSPL